MTTLRLNEPLARAILLTAVKEERAGELLSCLFEGGACTVDPETRRLILISADLIEEARTGKKTK